MLSCCFLFSVTFSDCKGNDKLRYEVSSPHFRVNSDGSLVALRNITAVGRTLFVHARTPHAEDMAELMIIGGKDVQGSLQVTLGARRVLGFLSYAQNGSLLHWPKLFLLLLLQMTEIQL